MNIEKIRKNILLFPFLFLASFLYQLLTEIRNLLFDTGIFKIHKFSIPVVSVGNITSGGTGKTPFILYLLNKLNLNYEKIVVVSRGYGRNSKGLQIVSDGEGNIIEPDVGGDEPVLIASKFPQIPVIVAEKRYKGIEIAIKNFDAKLILLDDAFQHRGVARDCDIVLVDANQPVQYEQILPLGNLREKKSNLNRADIIIISKIEKKSNITKQVEFYKNFNNELFYSNYKNFTIKKVNENLQVNLDKIKNESFFAFTGIANPKLFLQNLEDIGLKIDNSIIFKDHIKYSSKEISKILKTADLHNCNYLISTEKDLVKLNIKDFDDYNLFILEMEIELKNEENLIKKLKNCIDST